MTTFFNKNKVIQVWLVAIFVVAVWGETFVSSKLLIENGLKPADIFFYRFIIAYISMWAVSPKRLFASSWQDEARMALLGITGGSLYFLMENSALVYSNATNVAILVGSAPLLTALMAAALYKDERMNGRQFAGSVVAFAGMVLVVLNGKFVLHLNPLGDALALGAAAIWGVYSLIIRKPSSTYNIAFITRKVFFYGVLTILPYFALVHPLNMDAGILGRPVVWGNLLYLGLVASMLCFVAWNWALKKLGTVKTTNLIYCQCFFTMLVAKSVLGEHITWMAVLGLGLLIAGMMRTVR